MTATATQAKAFIQEYFQALSNQPKSEALLDRYMTDQDLKHHIAFFEASFPNYTILAEDMIAEGDKVSVRCRFQGTHKGDLMGLAPTGKSVDVPFQIIYRLEKGKIAEHWMAVDQMELMKQLGVGG